MRLFRSLYLWCGLAWLAAAGGAHAALTHEITQGVEGAVPIAVVPFGPVGANLPVDVAAVITADLRRSGRFAPIARDDLIARPYEASQVNFRDWRLLKADNLVIGKVTPFGAGYVAQFQLFDVFRGVQLAGYSIRSDAKSLRRTAHKIADMIYETLTGEPGAFATRIAYITVINGADGKRHYSLQVADSDGYNPQSVVKSTQPLMSPAWSPDATRLAYVSFENRLPKIYVQDLRTGRRRLLAHFPGVNGAPAWSPDGTQMALVLSKDGNPEVYVMDLATKRLRRLTDSLGIDTEPAWSPDGRFIIFTSDRGGSPQIYRIPSRGGHAQRLTFEGSYNARASYSADGKSIVMVHSGGDSRFRIAVLNLQNGAMQVLTDGKLDESPSFAPNGRMIIYATEEKMRGVLAAVSVDGRVKQRLSAREGDAREPAWAPLRQ
ncbi:MAG: Tol-Pal system beta propeller repeat protein TolB [Gammaproteobacteria bacterium]